MPNKQKEIFKFAVYNSRSNQKRTTYRVMKYDCGYIVEVYIPKQHLWDVAFDRGVVFKQLTNLFDNSRFRKLFKNKM